MDLDEFGLKSQTKYMKENGHRIADKVKGS